MDFLEQYVLDYSKNFPFRYVESVSLKVLDVSIDLEIFEYEDKYNHREKAHVVLKKGNLTYECDFCDQHDYENDFYPIILNGQRFICFRKTLYGFTLINADTLSVEYEYFPEPVIHGEESFIITEVRQLDHFLIFEGCYWACPYECFAFDYEKKLFFDVSRTYGLVSLDQTALQENALILSGTDKKGCAKSVTVTKQDLIAGIDKNGKTDF